MSHLALNALPKNIGKRNKGELNAITLRSMLDKNRISKVSPDYLLLKLAELASKL